MVLEYNKDNTEPNAELQNNKENEHALLCMQVHALTCCPSSYSKPAYHAVSLLNLQTSAAVLKMKTAGGTASYRVDGKMDSASYCACLRTPCYFE